jgi:Amt family ammonium transporter
VQYSANPIHENGVVTGAVMIFRDTAEARALARKMDYLASHDPLTGLYNRREFEQHLEQALSQIQDKDAQHILCYLDLDQFKVVNDTSGHQAGDELLRQLASLLHQAVRSSDILARLGGDEFGLLLNGCPMDDALHIADKLRGLIQDYRFVWENKTFVVGASIGLVPIGGEIDSITKALSAADTACYAAKDSGRNRVHVYEVHDDEMAQRRSEMRWVTRINEALDKQRFELRYQPIVSTLEPDLKTSAVEFLLTMIDVDGSEIPPGAFIPAAERYSLMINLDYWVVEQVFAWLHENRERLGSLQMCFINLSGQSVGQDKFRAFILEQLSRKDLPVEKICFEITETAAVANMSKAATFMRELKEHGCGFALDDFGSGMSSFSYLKSLPLDYIKIDGNFVRDMAVDPTDRAVVQAIHQVGSVMNIQTIAEFVETPEVLQELRDIGVNFAQGYFIDRPKPLAGYPV